MKISDEASWANFVEANKSMVDILREAVALMRKNSIPPCVVKSKKDARKLTKNDPLGRKWKVGEEYYRAETMRATIPIPANANFSGSAGRDS